MIKSSVTLLISPQKSLCNACGLKWAKKAKPQNDTQIIDKDVYYSMDNSKPFKLPASESPMSLYWKQTNQNE